MTIESRAELPLAPPLAFYESDPSTLAGPPGSLIDALELAAPEGIRAWAVLYRSTGVDGSAVGVSGLIVAPILRPGFGSGGLPIVAWAHGTTGLADACAPS
ncbi:MAG: lipase, partial [Chloroflexota bacterium]